MNESIDIKEYLHTLDTKEGLELVSKMIVKKYWNIDLDIPILVNPQMTRWYGRFRFKYVRNEKNKVIGKNPWRIEISGSAFRNFTKYAMLDLLKHELCHYACLKLGQSHSDGSVFFESELKRINATPTGLNMMKKGYKKRHKERKK